MEYDIYNQSEIRLFTDIYNYLKNNAECDIGGSISAYDIQDFLLTSSKLSKDTILQIADVSGGASQGWYSEREVFLALKLVSAAQQGIPITPHIPFSEIDLPLPQLLTNNNSDYVKTKSEKVKEPKQYASSPNLINLSDSDCPPSKFADGGYEIMVSEDGDDTYPAEGYGDEAGGSNFTSRSPSTSSQASDSPTPTNSRRDKHWTQPPLSSQWHGIVNEEHHQLLCTEEESSDRHSSDEGEEEKEGEREEGRRGGRKKGVVKGGLRAMEDTKGSSSEVREINEESANVDLDGDELDEEVWLVSDEQQRYYTNAFIKMQPDLAGLIAGPVAKQFFEKSKLSVSELRHIWQLSDVSKDGALSLEEFCTAMHLVVSRRNNVPLPDKLPSVLMPKSLKWTKFVESPTSSSNVSSPGPKPVSFDFQKLTLEKNPQILHPTALRVTPEGKIEVAEEGRITSQERDSSADKEIRISSVMSRSFHGETQNLSNDFQTKLKVGYSTLPQGIHANLRQYAESGSDGPTSLPPLPPLGLPMTSPNPHSVPLKDVPPPPPPRTSKTHVRSSSLDLKYINKVSLSKSPPSVTHFVINPEKNNETQDPRSAVALNELQEGAKRNVCSTLNHNSAFEIYRKPFEEKEGEDCKATKEPGDSDCLRNSRSVDKRGLLWSLHSTREKNGVLLRLNSELNQELAEVTEEKIALEFQLEQMKSFNN